jgi:lauroyl/myristoyl acyltransferase
VTSNLKIVFPELNEQQRESMTLSHLQWYGCALMDYSVLFFASQKRLANMVEIQGQEHIDHAINNKQSVMVLLAHSVMLEFAPAALGLHYECFGSYKNTKNALFDWMISRSRCRHVQFVVSRDEGLRKLIKSIQPGKLMVFLPDEDLGEKNAVFAPFFGKSKATLTTTARMAKMAKASALPAYCYYDSEVKKYITQIGPALGNYPTVDAIQDATIMNQGLEELITQNPEQYMWLLRWYKTRPKGEATVY